MNNKTIYIVLTLLVLTFTFVFTVIILPTHYQHKERLAEINLNETVMMMRMDSLEKRIVTFETLYRDHLEDCSFISNKQIRVGYDNYLQLIKEDGTIRN